MSLSIHNRIKRAGRVAAGLIALFAAVPAFGGLPKTQPPDNSATPTIEAWRIRIANYVDGAIEVSANQGATWSLVGRVSAPATQSLMGYLAAGYAPIGSVAATAVHGIRIRLGDTSSAYPTMINIVPREFSTTTDSFGGHVSGDSGIYTNIPAGQTLFRELAPYVGSPCYLINTNGSLQRLGPTYVPAAGDALMIVSRRCANPLRSLVLENRSGGDVTATYADGATSVVTHVAAPVAGVGRFDGTSYTGVGAVNTNHTCVITISTAPVSSAAVPEGEGIERRGGFQIEPSYHNSQTEEAGAPQVLVVGEKRAQDPVLEGRAPLFYGCVGLASSAADPAHSWICDVRTKDSGAIWLPMPEMIGDLDDAISRRGITAFRLHRDEGDDPAWLGKTITAATLAYREQRAKIARAGGIPLVRGAFAATCVQAAGKADLVEYYVDGSFAAITNSQPYEFDWDTRRVSDGEHLLETRAENIAGGIVSITRKLVYVDNERKIGRA